MKNRTSAPVDVLNALAGRDELRAEPPEYSDRCRPAGCNGSNRSGVATADRSGTMHLLPGEGLARSPHLAGVEEQDQPHRAGDVDVLLDVEQQALVAAEHEAGERIGRSDRADVEAADAVLAAEEQLLEDRQLDGAADRVDELQLPARAPATCGRSGARCRCPRAIGLKKFVLPPRPARSIDADEPLAGGREDRLVDGVVDDARRDLADDPLAARRRAAASRAGTGCARSSAGSWYAVVDLGDAHLLVAVVREHPREAAAEREAEGEHAALRLLRELADVADFLPEHVDAAGDVAVEEERLGEGDRDSSARASRPAATR